MKSLIKEVRIRMIGMVSKGLATLEVSLKHSGSLFMYAGHEGGAYAKNSFGNVYIAVGVFVLARIFRKAWGTEASKKQAEFNEFLEREHMSISMELVSAVLGDNGQRPREGYVVVTAVTEMGKGKPKFYSTPEIIAFCRKCHESSKQMELILQNYPSLIDEVDQDLGPGLREICAANRSDEKPQIKSLLQNIGTSFCPNYVDWFGFEEADIPPRKADRSVVSKFLQSNPSDYTTFKFKASKEEISKNTPDVGKSYGDENESSGTNNLADEDVNLMIKLKFLTYKANETMEYVTRKTEATQQDAG